MTSLDLFTILTYFITYPDKPDMRGEYDILTHFATLVTDLLTFLIASLIAV